ncbi:ABC transporter substrate-binding protein [Poseidonibacter ostreae]|uniref:ABC transporter substrate-binding protein n=1 Tax=Poseidonibacter ostreae TaxID=2654171 RepID=UPI00186B403F|nr:ABC transporter substrate-binding protein [Poseidonibacter ostreae]
MFSAHLKSLFFILIFFSSSLYSKELKPVTIQLSWFDQFQFAGYYIAKEKGLYEAYGLDVTIKPFEFGIDIPKEVSLGNLDFAVGRETLLLQRTKEQKIVALYALFQATPLVLLTTKESGISKINDFIGKTIMTTIDDASEVSLKSMISSHNIKTKDLKFIKHTHNINDLLDKKTDVISAYLSKSPFKLQQKGVEYNVFDPKMYGFDMYSDFLFTSEKLINSDIKTVDAFKKASLEGWEYAYSNIEETAALIIEKYNSSKLSKEALIYEANELKELSYFKTSKLGEIKKDKMQRIYDLYNVMGLTSEKVNIDDFIYYDRKIENLKFTKKEKEYLKNKKEIKVCIVNNYMPFSDIKDGKFVGAIADFINMVEKKLAVAIFPVETDSFSQSLQYIKEKKCNLIPSLSHSNEREKLLNFTQAYNEMNYVIVTQNDVPFISNMKEIKNKKIAVTQGHTISSILKNRYRNIDFVEVKNLDEGLLKVKNKEVFAFIGTNATVWFKLQSEFINDLKISGKIDEVTSVHMGIEKEDVNLLNILNKVVINIDEDIKQNILNKWLFIQHKKEFDYTILWKILLVVLVLLLGVLYRQKLLKKMNKSLSLKVEEKTKELIEINEGLENRIKVAVDENLKKDRIMSQQSKMAAIGEMMENIAHQWRQPLSLITTGSSGLKIKKELGILEDKFLIDTLDSIIASATNLSTTIDDFRDFFKPTREQSKFSLSECCNKTLDLLHSKLKNKNIRVIKNIESIEIEAYESELIQVIMSVLNNSRDAFNTVKNQERLIFIDVSIDEKDIIIKIKDNAGGVKKELLEKIYEPYFTTKHRSNGTGIGLYMCEKIITKHMNGKIESINKKYIYDDIEYKGLETTITLYPEN